MTPKQKAEELFDKFYNTLPSYTDEGQIEWQSAKQCSLIAVDEILFITKMYNDTYAETTYWQEVKTEIEKL